MGVQFKFLAASACLDFVNTVDRWVSEAGRPQPKDDALVSYESVLDWCSQSSLLPSATVRELRKQAQLHPRLAAEIHSRALSLRQAIWQTFSALASQGRPPGSALAIINSELERIPAEKFRLVGDDLELTREPDHSLQLPLVIILEDTLTLIRSKHSASVRMCAADECGWLFLDTSRNHKRRWCDMNDCGNRAKARRFYRREKRAAVHN